MWAAAGCVGGRQGVPVRPLKPPSCTYPTPTATLPHTPTTTTCVQYELLAESPEEADTGSGVSASLVTLRLNPEELGVRPVAVLGELGHATVRQRVCVCVLAGVLVRGRQAKWCSMKRSLGAAREVGLEPGRGG